MAHAVVPMDEAASTVIVDLSGRPYCVLELSFNDNDMAGFPTDLIRHFLESFAHEAKMNLHVKTNYGVNDHTGRSPSSKPWDVPLMPPAASTRASPENCRAPRG
jgi:imidazoleglycerol phosphate dehydratase HisB